MGEIRGYVTRNAGGRTIGLMGLGGGTGSISRNNFSATRADGTRIGSSDSVRRAQLRVENTVGFGLLSWRRIDIKTGIEHYEGRDQGFYPGDLNQLVNPFLTRVAPAATPVGLLVGGVWYRADQGVTTGANPSILRWNSFDGSIADQSATPSPLSPALVKVAQAGRPAARFSVVASQEMAITGGLVSISDSFVAVAGVNYRPAAREQTIIQNGAGSGFAMGVTVGGDWFVDSSTGRITGPAAVDGEFAVLSALTSPAGVGTTAFLNGVSFGTNIGSTIPGTWVVSDAATGWYEDISEIIVVPINNPQAHAKLVRYVQRRYSPS